MPTVQKVAEHAKLIAEVDTSYAIIRGHDSRVMEGMHPIARAILDGSRETDAVRFPVPAVPDLRTSLPRCPTDPPREVVPP